MKREKTDNSNSLHNRNDLKELISPYLSKWNFFILSISIMVVIAYLNIRYSLPKYNIKAKVQIIEDQSTSSELNAFRDLDIFSNGSKEIKDEIEIIKSRTNFIDVAKTLGLNIQIYSKGQVLNTELYKNTPIKLNILTPDSLLFKSRATFNLKIRSDSTFLFSSQEDEPLKIFGFGQKIKSTIGDIVFLPNKANLKGYYDNDYIIKISPLSSIAQGYKNRTNFSLSSEFSNIVTISLDDAVPEKAMDIIHLLIKNYNRNEIQNKKQIADKTSDFINDRITDIYGDLTSVDQSAQQYKSERGITDVESQSNINLNIGATSQQELENAKMQMSIAYSMKDIIDSQRNYETLPSSIALSDPSIAATAERYNQLVLDRKRLLESSNEKNPIIVNLDQQLEALRNNLQSSLTSMTNNLNLRVNNLSNQLSKINAQIYSAPAKERALRDIQRKQQTTEALYLYLLQKREESQILYASSSAKAGVIDSPYLTSNAPVSPNKAVIYLVALICGFALPFSFIYLWELLNSKIQNLKDLEKLLGPDVTILGEIPKVSTKQDKLVKPNERTVFAESLRIIRANLDFVIKSNKKNKDNGSVIFVSSSVSGEGKTLVSSNLAMVYAKANKKVLLIGADIRNPKIYQFYSGKDVDRLGKSKQDNAKIGLTDFLGNKRLGVEDIISPMLVHDRTVDVIYSGKVPPNPSELLMTERMKELLILVSQEYDYVIVDTAPLMVVSDTLLISEFADHMLYIVRANVTERKVLDFPVKLLQEGKLKGLVFVVNGVKESKLGYGGKYGYGYGEKTKKWWKFA